MRQFCARRVDDRPRARGPAGKAKEPFRASEMLAPKQVVEVNIMIVQQEKPWGVDEAARQANSRTIARRAGVWPQPGQGQDAAIAAELKDALAREAVLLREKDQLLRVQDILAQEFEHRLVNSLQLIVSLLV